MDSQLRSNGPSTRPSLQAITRPPARSRVAGRIERVVNTALAGEKAAVLNVTPAELLADPVRVAAVLASALDRPGTGVLPHWMVHELFRRSNVHDELLDSLASPDPAVRAAAARVCGAARLTESVTWIGDLLDDADPLVRESAVRALAQLGGRRAVELLMAAADGIPLHRLAIALSRAATDVDMEVLMRRPPDERTAVATVLACGLRRDVLRVSPLLGILHDRRWPRQVRLAACKALASIAERSAADGLRRIAQSDPDPELRRTAERAHRRLVRRAIAG